MTGLISHRFTAVWAILVIATITGTGTSIHYTGGVAFAIIMLVAMAKAHLIIHHYMELRDAPLYWRRVFAGLIAASGAIIIVLHIAL